MATITIDPNVVANLAADGIPTTEIPISSDSVFGVPANFPYTVLQTGTGVFVYPLSTAGNVTLYEDWTDSSGNRLDFATYANSLGVFTGDGMGDIGHVFSGL
jgi:hypothetical protein